MFKEARFWDTWNRELTSKAHLHDLSTVLDPDYVPTTAEENELFELQKRFIYSVFLSKVMVADDVNIVKTHQDAQLCYSALVYRFAHSPEAAMDANTIWEKIYYLKLDKSWRGTATNFLQHFESQIILLESLMEDRALLWLERMKMIMLESAVKMNKDLSMIMSQEHLDITKG